MVGGGARKISRSHQAEDSQTDWEGDEEMRDILLKSHKLTCRFVLKQSSYILPFFVKKCIILLAHAHCAQ